MTSYLSPARRRQRHTGKPSEKLALHVEHAQSPASRKIHLNLKRLLPACLKL